MKILTGPINLEVPLNINSRIWKDKFVSNIKIKRSNFLSMYRRVAESQHFTSKQNYNFIDGFFLTSR